MTLGLVADAPGIIPNKLLPSVPPYLSARSLFEPGAGPLAWGTSVELYRGGSGTDGDGLAVELTRLEAVPEPGTFALVAPFVLALVAIRRR